MTVSSIAQKCTEYREIYLRILIGDPRIFKSMENETRTVTKQEQLKSIQGLYLITCMEGPILWGVNRENTVAEAHAGPKFK